MARFDRGHRKIPQNKPKHILKKKPFSWRSWDSWYIFKTEESGSIELIREQTGTTDIFSSASEPL